MDAALVDSGLTAAPAKVTAAIERAAIVLARPNFALAFADEFSFDVTIVGFSCNDVSVLLTVQETCPHAIPFTRVTDMC